ncbi:MAG: type I restriction endonuclease [Gammaproteobacteria bacterium]|nr:type I restriction endonuclease [Gammaproteobacteria bacterium]
MTLEEILRKIARDLGSNRLQNEEHTKLVAILPILRALGWDDTHPGEFVPEHPVGNGRVDYALFNPKNELPLVFIEAKRPGNAGEQGEDQLFAYAANQGVPFLILTDGDSWNFFYLSMAAGRPSDRKFCQLSVQRCDERNKDHRSAH